MNLTLADLDIEAEGDSIRLSVSNPLMGYTTMVPVSDAETFLGELEAAVEEAQANGE